MNKWLDPFEFNTSSCLPLFVARSKAPERSEEEPQLRGRGCDRS
ncbi:MAG: hypothetical protein ACHQUC_10505 [Chlamydiales bacterium]